MKRLFFRIPDLKVAHDVALELVEIGIESTCIHVMGGDVATLKKAHLHPATLFHTNVAPAIKWGVLVGLMIVLLIFGLFTLFMPPDFEWAPLPIFGVIVFGMGFGIWASGMVSLVKNPIIEDNESYIKEGHYLMMVDVPAVRAEEVAQTITRHHQGTKLAEKKLR